MTQRDQLTQALDLWARAIPSPLSCFCRVSSHINRKKDSKNKQAIETSKISGLFFLYFNIFCCTHKELRLRKSWNFLREAWFHTDREFSLLPKLRLSSSLCLRLNLKPPFYSLWWMRDWEPLCFWVFLTVRNVNITTTLIMMSCWLRNAWRWDFLEPLSASVPIDSEDGNRIWETEIPS